MLLKSSKQLSLTAFFAVSLISCGGGGGSESSTPTVNQPNKAPVIADFAAQQVSERDAITVSSNASDSDGTIKSYKWIQTAGTSVVIENDAIADLTFNAPNVTASEVLTFQLTVTDNDDAKASKSVDVEVNAYAEADLAQITDPELAACLQDALVDTGVNSISCQRTKVASLAGMSQFTELTELSINNTAVTEVSELASLTKLKKLNLANNKLTDISSLNALTELTELDLSNNNIGSALGTTVGSMTKLQTLKLDNAAYSSFYRIDAAELKDLTELTSLNINSLEITNAQELSNLTNLNSLVLSNTRLSSLSFLLPLTKLTELDISKNSNVNDLSALAEKTSLISLNLSETAFDSLASLAKLTNLKKLLISIRNYSSRNLNAADLADLVNLEELEIGNFSTLENVNKLNQLTKLTNLRLVNVNLSTLGFLEDMSQLQILDISNNSRLSDLSSLSGLAELKELNISQNGNISELAFLESMGKLEKLDLSDIHNTNLNGEPLAKLPELVYLNLSGNTYMDLTFLSSLVKLEELEARHISDYNTAAQWPDLSANIALSKLTISDSDNASLTKIATASTLQQLSIERMSDVTSLANIEPLSNLHTLKITSATMLMDISALAKLTKLQNIYLAASRLEDTSPLLQLNALTEIDLTQSAYVTCANIAALEQKFVNATIKSNSDCVKTPWSSVTIADDNLKACLERTNKDVEDITSVHCYGPDIASTEGIELVPNLASFSFSPTVNADLSALAKTEITSLKIDRSSITSLSIIPSIPTLATLDISYTAIKSFEGLPVLSSLKYLSGRSNQNLNSFAGLSGLTTLERLDLESNNLTTLASLPTIPNVTVLEVDFNKLTSLSGIEKLPKLSRINASYNQLTDITAAITHNVLSEVYLYGSGNNGISCADLNTLSESKRVYHSQNCN